MGDLQRLIICNLAARRSRRQPAVDHLTEQLRARGMAGEVVHAHDWADAVKLARQAAEAGYAQVVAAGGDGTVNAVANGLVGTEAALGVLPFGTGNVLAHNLHIPTIPAALAALEADRRKRLDLGRIGGARYFVAVAGVGLDAQVARSVVHFWKQSLGRLAFITEGMNRLRRDKPRLFHIDIEGEDCTAVEDKLWSAFFCNVPEHTWRLSIVKEARPDDGWLHLVLFRDVNVFRWAFGMGDALLGAGNLGQVPGVTVHRVKKARVTSEPPWLWQADGDVGGETPVEVEVCPGALQVVVGEDSA
jgi:YegS/Rv2252/BmrU family lipid kinase